jgi:hypothetical protein
MRTDRAHDATGSAGGTARRSSGAGRRPPWLLVTLEALVGLGALGGAAAMMIDGAGMDPRLLDGTPFDSWTLPGLALVAAVGLPMLGAAYLEILRRPRAAQASLAAGVALLAWIVVQVAVIGFQSVLQPAMFLAGLAICGLALPSARTPPAGASRASGGVGS